MNIQGKIKKIGELQEFSNDFKKKVVLIETKDQYPQTLPVEFVKDNIQKLDYVKEGDDVDVSINLRGSEYNGKHYVNIVGWFIKSNKAETLPSSDLKDDSLPF